MNNQKEEYEYWIKVHAEWAELHQHCKKTNTGLLKQIEALIKNALANVKRLTQPDLFA